MASLMTVRLDKGSSPNLGFRLQGGKDFGTPLVIQKVNGGSPAERAGLIAGDSVIKINNIDVFNLRHKDAQDVVVRAGPSFEMTIQRGGSTWKPSVTPVYSPPSTNFNNVSPVTRTSLAANKTENIGSIGTGHNLSAKPFSPQVNGSLNGGPKLVNKQYNSPVKLYSEESIAETLSAQTEVLSTGALGVNFKKNERNYDASNSEVLRALKEAENEPDYSDREPDSGVVTTPNSGIAGLRHVQAPENRPQPSNPQLPPGQNICADCERLIVGVFVRIKDKNLHVECFKCSTCGSSLKNVGYYNINNKLYCDIHAKAAALKHQSNPNLVPVTVPPGGRAPAHAISSALSSHPYPTSSPISPKLNSAGTPYQGEESKENVGVVSSLPILPKSNVTDSNLSNTLSSSTPLSFSNYLNKTSNFSGPKPFSNVSAPLSPHSTLHRSAPLSPVAPAPAPSFNHSYTPSAYSPSSGRVSSFNKPAGGLFKVQIAEIIVWPPPQTEPEVPTACPLFYPPPSQVESKIIHKKISERKESECSDCTETEEMSKYFTEYSSGIKSAEEIKETLTETIDTQILVDNIVKKSVTPIEGDLYKKPKSPTPSKDFPVPLKWESPLTQAIRTTSPDKDTFACIPTKHSASALATALSIAPLDPFKPSIVHEKPVPLPEETEPYFPPEHPVITEKEGTAPPIRKKYGPADKLFEGLPKPEGKLTMTDALTTASDRPYSPFVECVTEDKKEEKTKQYFRGTVEVRESLPDSFAAHKKEPLPPVYYPPIISKTSESITESKEESKLEESQETIIQKSIETQNQATGAPLFHGFSCSFSNKGDISQFSVDVRTTPPVISPPTITQNIETKHTQRKEEEKKTVKEENVVKQKEEIIPVKAVPPVTLHKPTQLPPYQVEISAEAESELILLEKKRQAELRIEQQKQSTVQPPVIKLEVEHNQPAPQHPRSTTPSQHSSRPPSVLPYYQANLVPQYMGAAQSNVFDPKSPATSRSPSPAPGTKERSPSPLPGGKSNLRPASPAGPPENPLKSTKPLPTPDSIRFDKARDNIKEYLPEYKIQRDYLEETKGMDLGRKHSDAITTQNYSYPMQGQSVELKRTELLEAQQSEKSIRQDGSKLVSISKEEQLKQAHLEQMKQSQTQSIERSADGLTQVQRKQIVTEEFENMHKEVNIQIEKNVTSTSQVREPSTEMYHMTDPQRLSSTFLKSGCSGINNCLKNRLPASVTASNKHAASESSKSSKKPNVSSVCSQPDTGATSGRQAGGVKIAPRRGRGILNPAAIGGARIPLCGSCNMQVRGPFITALGKIWCPNHFICSTPSCRRPLQDIGFVEERGQLYCEYCFEQYLAPPCSKCGGKIKGDCLKAIGKNFHPECFNCTYCGKLFGNSPFFLEDGSPYCEADWNELFTTKCYACAFPIEAGDRWVEALNNNYHSQCFNCTMCKKNLEGQSFFAKGGRPFCKNHAR